MRSMFRGALVGAMALTPALVHRVHAEGETHKVKVKDLPLYREPEPPQLVYIPEKISAYRENISVVRQAVSGYYDSVRGTSEKVKQKLDVAKAHTMNVFQYFREDAGAIPKVTFITLSGLGGLIIGYKGRPSAPFRTAVLATSLVAGSSYVCYPDPVGKAAGQGWDRLKAQYHQLRSATPSTPVPAPEQSEAPAAASSSKDVVSSSSNAAVTVSEADKDHGMSVPEDKDLYTTRTS